ncbi:hypothetical protein DFH09DRAFT_1484596 [Mycena vulgaris]|nr:hypothetical protein DFH09DRAFT_1484596 [Mycena vulgaris]
MDDSDNSWCATCDRQIVPKRTLVPVHTQQPIPPPSPTHDSPRRSKQGTIRQRSGLVHGTGRVRPNGTIKRAADVLPAAPIKTRVEIDQSPAPLYCSDACRQKDVEFFHGRPVYSDSASSDTSDDADSLASLSNTSQDEYTYPAPQRKSTASTANTRSLAVLQREYRMPPLPPPTSETYDELAPRVPRVAYRPPEYTSGVMMANRRIDAVLPKALKPGERPPPLAPVPGWTDGSQAWRASTYSFAPPPRTRADILDPNRAAYESFRASPHRSAASGVTANTDHPASMPSPPSPTDPVSASTSSSINSELLESFGQSFARRSEARARLSSSASSSSPTAGSPPRRSSRALAAGNMLLVPDVLKRPRAGASCDSLADLPSRERGPRRHSSGALPPALSFPGPSRVVSPLARASVLSSSADEDEDPEEAAYVRACPDEPAPRPVIETRSWSYDNVRTYPVMAMPALKERRVVDGVEVEVEVPRPFKKLFTFAGVPLRRSP